MEKEIESGGHRRPASDGELHRILVEEAQDLIFALDLNGAFTFVNHAAATITGWSPEQWLGKRFLSVLAPEEVALGMAVLNQVFAGRNPPAVELTILSQSGEKVALEVLLTARHPTEGKLLEVFGIARDTRLRRLGAVAQNGDHSDSLGRLASGIAHHYNNLLTIQRGYLSFLMEDMGEQSPRLARCVKEVAHAAERAAHLTRELLLFSQMEPVHLAPTDVGKVVQQMSNDIRRSLRDEIRLEIECGLRVPPVMADRAMLEQIVLSLVANAKDAMPGEGRLLIRVEPGEMESSRRRECQRRPERTVCLSVSDTGCGIPSALTGKIFDPFFTTKDIGKGTGLGLASVYGIVRRHHGWIDVESRVGEGATFRIYLPEVILNDAAGGRNDKAELTPLVSG